MLFIKQSVHKSLLPTEESVEIEAHNQLLLLLNLAVVEVEVIGEIKIHKTAAIEVEEEVEAVV